MKQHYPDIRCLITEAVIAGTKVYKESIVRFVQENGLMGNVIFTGFLKDIAAVLRTLGILLHASVDA